MRPRHSLVVASLTALVGLSACGSGGSAHPAGSRSTVQVSVSSCGTGWHADTAGPVHLRLHDTDSRPGEARIVAPGSGAVFADVEPLGDGTSAPLDVTLRAGQYALQCLMEDEAPVTGRVQTLTGTLPVGAQAAPGVVPVTQADLIPASRAYQRYVSGQLPRLAGQVRALRAALARGDRAAARRDWLAAHLRYERLGAAYDAFGHLDRVINGLRGPGWTGFHRIEYDLWHRARPASLVGQADRLGRAVAALRRQFADTQIDPLQIGIRAHEISENALQFSLTGRDDYGSHSDVATVRANLQGTQVVLGLVTALLTSRHVDLGVIHAAIRRTDAALSAHPADHERVDAALGQLCELLAPVASVLEPRRTS